MRTIYHLYMRIKYAHYQPPVRHHGKPLVSIEERPVPQNASQHTSPTQPIPVGDDVVPHFIDAALETGELLNEGRTFTPFDAKPVLYKQLAGINWPPMSYDLESHVLYDRGHYRPQGNAIVPSGAERERAPRRRGVRLASVGEVIPMASLQWHNKHIPAPCDIHDITVLEPIVPEYPPQGADVHTQVGILDNDIGPDLRHDLVFGNHLAGSFDQPGTRRQTTLSLAFPAAP